MANSRPIKSNFRGVYWKHAGSFRWELGISSNYPYAATTSTSVEHDMITDYWECRSCGYKFTTYRSSFWGSELSEPSKRCICRDLRHIMEC
jgi:hypothetical protein